MGEPGGFGVPDHVLSAGAMTLSELERGDVLAACVGDERCVPESFDRVEQRQLGAGMRPPRRTISRVPSGQASRFTRLVSSTTSAPSRSVPSASMAGCQHPVGTQMTPSRTLSSIRSRARTRCSGRRIPRPADAKPSRIGTNQDLPLDHARVVTGSVPHAPCGRQLSERVSEQHERDRSRCSHRRYPVEHAGKDFVGLGAHCQQRVMAVGAFVGRCGVLLVGLGAD